MPFWTSLKCCKNDIDNLWKKDYKLTEFGRNGNVVIVAYENSSDQNSDFASL